MRKIFRSKGYLRDVSDSLSGSIPVEALTIPDTKHLRNVLSLSNREHYRPYQRRRPSLPDLPLPIDDLVVCTGEGLEEQLPYVVGALDLGVVEDSVRDEALRGPDRGFERPRPPVASVPNGDKSTLGNYLGKIMIADWIPFLKK